MNFGLSHHDVLVALLTSAILLGGCDRRDAIQTYQVPKSLPVPSNDTADTASDTAAPIHWTVPDGWKYIAGHDLRFASFQVSPDDPSVQLSVIPLGAEAGSLVSNVNRWQKELGLPPTAQTDLNKVVTLTELNGASAGVLDLTGPAPTDSNPQKRMLAAIIPRPNRTWFFKLAGPISIIAAQKDKFTAFMQSIKFDADATQAPDSMATSDSQPPTTQPAALSYSTPDGWVQETARNEFRVVAFQIPSNNEAAEVVVARLPANSGSLLDNINRWRGEVGLAAASDPAQAPSAPTKIDGMDATVWDMESAAGAEKPSRMVVAMLPRGSDWWFFKLKGPVELVSAQKQPFMGFLSSIKFPGDTQ